MRMGLSCIVAFALIGILKLPARAEFQAAAGKIDITPTGTCFIAGYSNNRRSEGVHDPLWARCLVMRNGAATVALVSCDAIGISRYTGQKIRALVKSVPTANVLVGATHTHSGADTQGLWGPNSQTSGVDRAWLDDVVHRVAELIDSRAGMLRPARL